MSIPKGCKKLRTDLVHSNPTMSGFRLIAGCNHRGVKLHAAGPHNGGMAKTPAEFRRSGDECLRLAARAASPQDKERWLKLAKHWFAMARQEEERGELN